MNVTLASQDARPEIDNNITQGKTKRLVSAWLSDLFQTIRIASHTSKTCKSRTFSQRVSKFYRIKQEFSPFIDEYDVDTIAIEDRNILHNVSKRGGALLNLARGFSRELSRARLV